MALAQSEGDRQQHQHETDEFEEEDVFGRRGEVVVHEVHDQGDQVPRCCLGLCFLFPPDSGIELVIGLMFIVLLDEQHLACLKERFDLIASKILSADE